MEEIADFLRAHSKVILASTRSDQERQTKQLMLEEFVLRLDANYQRAQQQTHRSQPRGSRGAEHALTMVKSLGAALHLRNRRQLRECIKKAAEAAFPYTGLDPSIFRKLPSRSAVQRSQFIIDAAYCCYMQRILTKHNGPLNLWVDASIQGGTDWLLATCELISKESVCYVMEASNYLLESNILFEKAYEKGDWSGSGGMQEIVAKRHECGLELEHRIQRHRLPPMALGSGHASLVHKAKAVCQMFYAEAHSKQLLRGVLERVEGVCTDMGTEAVRVLSKDTEVGNTRSTTRPPPPDPPVTRWCIRNESRCLIIFDPLKNPLCKIRTDVVGSPSSCWVHSLPLLQAGLADLPLDLEDILPSWMDDELQMDVACDSHSWCSGERPKMLPNALIVAGTAHIVHNLCDTLDSALDQWSVWLNGFKTIANLLHRQHLRQRLVGLCIRGTQNAWAEKFFLVSVPKPATWRWGAIIEGLRRILSLKDVLKTVWNPSRFNKGEGQKAMADHAEPFDSDAVTKAIKSSWWWVYAEMVYQLNLCVTEFGGWLEGCSCHSWLQKHKGPLISGAGDEHDSGFSKVAVALEQCRQEMGLQPGKGDSTRYGLCPLAGKRAVELATGIANASEIP